ncbi:40S ribosomal protein S5-1 [Hordeum vulgare]|nr:40S ribosomal protein S5-1 [Hordeum vulgare]
MVINAYLPEVMKHPQTIEMRDGVLHIRDVQGAKRIGTVEARLEAVKKEIFRCQGMMEHGLSAKHAMITEFTRDPKLDGRPLEDIVFTLNEQINFLQGQIFDLQNQIFEYKAMFKADDRVDRRVSAKPSIECPGAGGVDIEGA